MTTGRPVHRFLTKKAVLAPIGVMAVTAACFAGALPAAQASTGGEQPCTPSQGTPAVFGPWAQSGSTDWQTTQDSPVDPDGQSGEDNVANVTRIGTVEHRSVSSASTYQMSDWLRSRPAGDGWSQLPGEQGERQIVDVRAYDETVVDHQAYDETVVDSAAVNQWYHWNGGYQVVAPAPPPANGWNTDNGAHNGLTNKPDYAPNKVFDASSKGSHNASWFFHASTTAVTHVVHHAAVTHVVHHLDAAHPEFRFERTVETPSHTEYRWAVDERANEAATPAVECPAEDPIDPVDPVDPVDPITPSQPTDPTTSPRHHRPHAATQPHTLQQPSASQPATQPHRSSNNQPTVPLSIDAGL